MQPVTLADAGSVAEEACRRIVRAARAAQRQRGRFALALAGGSTPRHTYERLARADVDWQRVHVFWGDERALPPDDWRSNQRMARAAWLDSVSIPPTQVYPMPADLEDLDAAARDYEQTLRRELGTPPRLDLILLGLGEDGHTASLFPGSAALMETERLVVATSAPAIAPRLTLTPVAIRAAREILFLVTGAAKAPALRRLQHGAHDPWSLPPHAIHRDDAVWLVDRAAHPTAPP
ncbi:MAG: 6-phosphogluconolactonase [Candidatus Latescibacterota bacterium]|nr:MAG: 6-phosphogluconolactonase [Candidatus Latescibacterota bacterium]